MQAQKLKTCSSPYHLIMEQVEHVTGLAEQMTLYQEIHTRGSLSQQPLYPHTKEQKVVKLEGYAPLSRKQVLDDILQSLRQKLKQAQYPYLNALDNFDFTYELTVGDILPSIHNLHTVLKPSHQCNSIHCKPGEILLICLWATWKVAYVNAFQKLVDIAANNQERWNGRVRVVGVNADHDASGIDQFIKQRNWTNIQHFAIGSWNPKHDLIRFFHIDKPPYVVLVNSEGVVEHTGHPSFVDVQSRINTLLNGKAQPVKKVQKKSQLRDYLSQNKEMTFEETQHDETLSKLILNTEKLHRENLEELLEVSYSQAWMHRFGKKERHGTELKVSYKCTPEKGPLYSQIVQRLVSNLNPYAFFIDGYVTDKQTDRLTQQACLNKILRKNKLQGKVRLVTSHKYNLVQSLSQTETVQYFEYPALGPSDMSSATAKQIEYEVTRYAELLAASKREPELVQRLSRSQVIRYIGSKMMDISEKNIYRSDKKQKIDHDLSSVWLFCHCFKTSDSQSHVRNLIDVITHRPDVKLVLFYAEKETHSDLLDGLIEKNLSNIRIYACPLEENEFLTPFYIRSWENVTVVDRKGIVRASQRTDSQQSIIKLIQKVESVSERQSFEIEPSLIQKWHNYLKSQQANQLIKIMKTWDYIPVCEVTYHESAGVSQFKKATVCVREEYRQLFDQPLQILRQFGYVDETYIRVFKIPKADTCDSCKKVLECPPYYYYYWSQVHRCVDCAHRLNPDTEDTTQKYAHPENSVLVLAENSDVDIARLGKNRQPKNKEEASRKHPFECNGCGRPRQQFNTLPRYICGGCHREPNPECELVDFCYWCVNILISGAQQQKAVIQAANVASRHRNSHALIRVNFNVKGYHNW